VGQFKKKKNFSTAKTAEKNSCKGSHGEKIEQVMSTNQALCLTSLKNYYTSYATTQKIMHNLKKRKKFHDPENCPPPKKNIMVCPQEIIKVSTLIISCSSLIKTPLIPWLLSQCAII